MGLVKLGVRTVKGVGKSYIQDVKNVARITPIGLLTKGRPSVKQIAKGVISTTSFIPVGGIAKKGIQLAAKPLMKFAAKKFITRTSVKGASFAAGEILGSGKGVRKMGIVKKGMKIGAAGIGLAAAGYGAEKLAERLGVRGGAGFIGKRDAPGEGKRKHRRGRLLSKRGMKQIKKLKRWRKEVRTAMSALGIKGASGSSAPGKSYFGRKKK